MKHVSSLHHPHSFAKLVGLNYSQYNKAHAPGHYDPLIHDYPDQQRVVNTAIPLINEIVTKYNTEMGLPGPKLNETVHDYINKEKLCINTRKSRMAFTQIH